MEISNKITLKQRKFLNKYFEYGNGTRAALEVYNTQNPVTAASIAHENLRKLQNHLRVIMENRGLDLNKLLTVLEEGLENSDYSTKHRYLETAAKWLGVESEAKTISSIQAEQAIVFQVIRGDN